MPLPSQDSNINGYNLHPIVVNFKAHKGNPPKEKRRLPRLLGFAEPLNRRENTFLDPLTCDICRGAEQKVRLTSPVVLYI